MNKTIPIFVAVFLLCLGSVSLAAPQVILEGLATLPADTYASGPKSGAFEGSGLRGKAKYTSQPVLGFSGIWSKANGSYYVLTDNGFGSQKNSPDFYLRIYEVKPDFNKGKVKVLGYIQLQDPDKKLNYKIVNEFTKKRYLTGADLDTESFFRATDGSFWIGDEFGPFVVQVDKKGKVLSAPLELPDVRTGSKQEFLRSPNNPFLASFNFDQNNTSTVRRSRGLEALATNPDQTKLYLFLEASIKGDPKTKTRIIEYDLKLGRYTGRQWFYRLASSDHVVAAAKCIADDTCLLVERDGKRNKDAQYKKLVKVKLDRSRVERYVPKEVVVDFLDIQNPLKVGGFGTQFTYPYECIEAFDVLDPQHIIVVNDNNFPKAGDRYIGKKNDSEFILLKLDKSLIQKGK